MHRRPLARVTPRARAQSWPPRAGAGPCRRRGGRGDAWSAQAGCLRDRSRSARYEIQVDGAGLTRGAGGRGPRAAAVGGGGRLRGGDAELRLSAELRVTFPHPGNKAQLDGARGCEASRDHELDGELAATGPDAACRRLRALAPREAAAANVRAALSTARTSLSTRYREYAGTVRKVRNSPWRATVRNPTPTSPAPVPIFGRGQACREGPRGDTPGVHRRSLHVRTATLRATVEPGRREWQRDP